MAGEEIGAASFGLVVGLNKFRSQLKEGEKIAGQSGEKMGAALTGGIDRSLTAGMSRVGDTIRKGGSQVASAGKSMTIGITAPLVAIGGLAVNAAIDFETAFADVRKTVDATDAQFSTLEAGIKAMSERLPETAVDIAAVVAEAGALGIATENLLGFTEAMVGLGTATDMTSTEAATAFARIANVMQTPQTEFERMGSTVVDLGNKMAATESEIVEMATRLTGAGKTIGLTEAEVLGFAAALSSVGIQAEAGGTAMSQVMTDMASAVATGGTKLTDFATVAGMSATQFATAFQTAPASAIEAFVGGLQRVQTSGGNVFGTLEQLGLGGDRVRDALLRLAGAGDIVSTSIDTANQAWADNSALQAEVAARNETSAAQWEMFKNKANNLAITVGEVLIPALVTLLEVAEPILKWLTDAVKWFTELPIGVQQGAIAFVGMAIAMGPVLWIGGNIVKTFGTFLGLAPKIVAAIRFIGSATLFSNPYVIAFVAALAGTYIIIRNWDTIKKWFQDFGPWLKRTGASMWDGIVDGFKAAINVIIRAWNGISFTVPSFSLLGRNIGGQKLTVPQIPLLAKGGDITHGGLAVVGDRGPEILALPGGASVSPLQHIPDIDLHEGRSRPQITELHLDGRVLSRWMVNEMSDRQRITGRPAFGR